MKTRNPTPPTSLNAPIDSAELGVRVDGSLVRCPFCHDAIELEEPTWVACAGCVARHHGECWAENGAVCGACGGAGVLTRETKAAPKATQVRLPLRSRSTRGRESAILNGPLSRTQEARFTGELDLHAEAAWVEAEARRALKTEGVARVTNGGTRLEWRPTFPAQNQGGCAANTAVTITIESKSGKTRLEVGESYGDLHGALYGSVVGGVGGGFSYFAAMAAMAILPVHHEAAAMLGVLAWIVLTWLAVRQAMPRLLERRRQSAERLMERLVSKLARPEATTLK